MKNYLFFFTVLFFISGIDIAQTIPTCSLDPTFILSIKRGIWPDSATGFSNGVVATEYYQNITVKVPKDTLLIAGNPTTRVCFNRFELKNPTGYTNYNLPPGLTLTVSTAALNNGTINAAPSFKFPGNANNCAMITGTPTTAGTYTLHLQVDAFATPSPILACPASPNVNSGNALSTNNLNYYIIKIDPYVGIKEINNQDLKLRCVPNPALSRASIIFESDGVYNVKLIIRNILGEEVKEINEISKPGSNKINFETQNWNPGIYFYTVIHKNNICTRRLLVADEN